MHENLAAGSLSTGSFLGPFSSRKLDEPTLVQEGLVGTYLKLFYASNSAELVYRQTAMTARWQSYFACQPCMVAPVGQMSKLFGSSLDCSACAPGWNSNFITHTSDAQHHEQCKKIPTKCFFKFYWERGGVMGALVH